MKTFEDIVNDLTKEIERLKAENAKLREEIRDLKILLKHS